MNTLLTILTIATFPVYGIWMFRLGRKFEKELTDAKLDNLINIIKLKEKSYETRDKEID